VFAQRYWCPVNAPVLGADGRVMLIAQCVEEITDKVRRFVDNLSAGEQQLVGAEPDGSCWRQAFVSS
jgi:hypothetical protein